MYYEFFVTQQIDASASNAGGNRATPTGGYVFYSAAIDYVDTVTVNGLSVSILKDNNPDHWQNSIDGIDYSIIVNDWVITDDSGSKTLHRVMGFKENQGDSSWDWGQLMYIYPSIADPGHQISVTAGGAWPDVATGLTYLSPMISNWPQHSNHQGPRINVQKSIESYKLGAMVDNFGNWDAGTNYNELGFGLVVEGYEDIPGDLRKYSADDIYDAPDAILPIIVPYAESPTLDYLFDLTGNSGTGITLRCLELRQPATTSDDIYPSCVKIGGYSTIDRCLLSCEGNSGTKPTRVVHVSASNSKILNSVITRTARNMTVMQSHESCGIYLAASARIIGNIICGTHPEKPTHYILEKPVTWGVNTIGKIDNVVMINNRVFNNTRGVRHYGNGWVMLNNDILDHYQLSIDGSNITNPDTNFSTMTLWGNIIGKVHGHGDIHEGTAVTLVFDPNSQSNDSGGPPVTGQHYYDSDLYVGYLANYETVPGYRKYAAIAWDASRHYGILFGGLDNNGNLLTGTCKIAYTGGQYVWTDMAPGAEPPARFGHQLIYSAAAEKIYLVGGYDGTQYYGDMWEWDDELGYWVETIIGDAGYGARAFHALAFDDYEDMIILFGGRDDDNIFGDTWVFNAGSETWNQLEIENGPAARWGHSMVYNASHNYTTMFGGSSGLSQTANDLRNDTWLLSVGFIGWRWAIVNHSNSYLPAKMFHCMEYSPNGGMTGEPGVLCFFGHKGIDPVTHVCYRSYEIADLHYDTVNYTFDWRFKRYSRSSNSGAYFEEYPIGASCCRNPDRDEIIIVGGDRAAFFYGYGYMPERYPNTIGSAYVNVFSESKGNDYNVWKQLPCGPFMHGQVIVGSSQQMYLSGEIKDEIETGEILFADQNNWGNDYRLGNSIVRASLGFGRRDPGALQSFTATADGDCGSVVVTGMDATATASTHGATTILATAGQIATVGLNAISITVEQGSGENIPINKVLFIYDRDSADSIRVAQYYQTKHQLKSQSLVGLPLAILHGFSLPADCETPITKEQYMDNIETPLWAAIEALSGYLYPDLPHVIILGHGLPLSYADDSGEVIAIASRLHRIGHSYVGKHPNPTFNRQGNWKRFDDDDSHNVFMTAVIDGPTTDAAMALIDRGIAITNDEYVTGKLYVDPYAPNLTASDQTYQANILDWVENSAPYLGLDIIQTVPSQDPYEDVSVYRLKEDSFYWGRGVETYNKDLFEDQIQKRCFLYNADAYSACKIHYYNESQHSPFDPQGSDHWCNLAINVSPGYAACSGAVDDPGADAYLQPDPFFYALKQGATVGEAYLFASQYVEWKTILIGDPLVRVGFPHPRDGKSVPSESRIPIDAVIDLTKKNLENSLGWGMRQVWLTQMMVQRCVSSTNMNEETNLLQPLVKWQDMKATESQYNIITGAVDVWNHFVLDSTIGSLVSWLDANDRKVSAYMSEALKRIAAEEIPSRLIYPSGSWSYRFTYNHQFQTLESVHFVLQISATSDFARVDYEIATKDSADGWKYEAKPYYFISMSGSGMLSNYSGRMVEYEATATNLLVTNGIYYVRWRAIDTSDNRLYPIETEWQSDNTPLIIAR
jgi:uncharacterized protein (TIGR03790 family)